MDLEAPDLREIRCVCPQLPMLHVLQRLEEADARSAGKETSFCGAGSRSHRFLGPCARFLAQTQWAGGGGRTRGLSPEAGGPSLHGHRVAAPARGRTCSVSRLSLPHMHQPLLQTTFGSPNPILERQSPGQGRLSGRLLWARPVASQGGCAVVPRGQASPGWGRAGVSVVRVSAVRRQTGAWAQ